ncbi:hypothetical protein FCG85_013945 [Enterobacter hormaechei]|uniref:hypothetical protein n=2 Tax=Enterobacter TaxID=547 RepID=UPI001C0B5D73|nr:hypothetical protein [Enterobacter hormaechei]QWS88427.1 hypothetical protein FCG85_010370 [Enterobacter hormaechei]QWS89090.1 hypothetical protein FCG85_013945 [Enterobacter hormaechei]
MKAGYTLGHADVAILNELARIALASLEAEPVPGLFIKCSEIEPCPGKETITQAEPMADGKYHESCFRLYTAPPAPASVPDVVSWEDVPEEITEDDIALASAWAHGLNQCRAAMLQGAAGGSPVIKDGWDMATTIDV